jgi:hypothetical protein
MPPAEFEPAFPASQRPQIHALDRAATGICPSNIIRVIKSRRMIWEGHVTRMGENRNAYRVFFLESLRERKRLLGRPRFRWEDNSNVSFKEIGWLGEDWFSLA